MSSLLNKLKPRPAVYAENGHGFALRDGNAYCMTMSQTINSGAVLELRFKTGEHAVKFYSGIFTIDQEDVLFEVYEDTTFSDGGTINTDYGCPMNRIQSAKTTELEFYEGAVVDTDGTLFMRQRILGAAGQGQNKPGFGSAVSGAKRILKPNTEHIFRITNNSDLASIVEAYIVYHQVNPKAYQ